MFFLPDDLDVGERVGLVLYRLEGLADGIQDRGASSAGASREPVGRIIRDERSELLKIMTVREALLLAHEVQRRGTILAHGYGTCWSSSIPTSRASGLFVSRSSAAVSPVM